MSFFEKTIIFIGVCMISIGFLQNNKQVGSLSMSLSDIILKIIHHCCHMPFFAITAFF